MDMGCFYFLAIMNNAAVNILFCVWIDFLNMFVLKRYKRAYTAKSSSPAWAQTPIPHLH